MTTKGGNTERYQGDGRKIMAETLAKEWPQYVEVRHKFGRHQHHIKKAWRNFNTKLIRDESIDWKSIPKVIDYGLKLTAIQEVKSDELKQMLENERRKNKID